MSAGGGANTVKTLTFEKGGGVRPPPSFYGDAAPASGPPTVQAQDRSGRAFADYRLLRKLDSVEKNITVKQMSFMCGKEFGNIW